MNILQAIGAKNLQKEDMLKTPNIFSSSSVPSRPHREIFYWAFCGMVNKPGNHASETRIISTSFALISTPDQTNQHGSPTSAFGILKDENLNWLSDMSNGRDILFRQKRTAMFSR